MKNAKFEKFGRMQREYHRHHPWRLSQGGLFITSSYKETKPDSLSWWDDVGFILSGRRVIVWWQHPRLIYLDAIGDQAREKAGENPGDDWLLDGSTANYRRVGNSRKRIVSYTCRQPSQEQQTYYDNLRDIRERLSRDGIDFEATISWKRERLSWAMGVSLIAPLEVRNETELPVVAKLARRLMLGQTTLEAEFPGYRYGKTDWLREQDLR